MKFTKMQGIGNDYVYVNCFTEKVENPDVYKRQQVPLHIIFNTFIIYCQDKKFNGFSELLFS